MSTSPDASIVDQTLRIAGGVEPAERAGIVEHWSSLDHRLRSFDPSAVELQLTVKERDTPSQKATLEAWIAGFPRLVATSSRTDFDAAMIEVRDDMIRRISDTKQRTEPRNNKHRRDTTRR
jgi:ribosome-associated translation inhibitor RaiA